MVDEPRIEKLIKLSFISLALTPLIVTNSTLFPFMYGKAVFIRFVIAVAGVLFAIGIFNKKKPIKLKLDRLTNPFVIAQAVFVTLTLISTALASNPLRAFWGDVERSEGFLILIYVLLFFLGALLFFEEKDWLNFFKVNLIIGGIVAVDVLIDWLGGSIRSEGSFFGNPAFVSTYALFAIFYALMVGAFDKSKTWLYISRVVIIASFAAIFVSGTRGVIVGLAVASLIILLRLAFAKRTDSKISFFRRTIGVKRLAVILLLIMAVFSITLVLTRNASIWQKIPGLDRIVEISSTDQTTQTRLINIGISLDAVNPVNVGITKTLFGWGPEGYISAHNQFYNPGIQKYEISWFDRAHNKILDVLVMNGAFGLLAYLAIWTILFWKIFGKRRPEDHDQSNKDLRVSLIIGGVAIAYFVQGIFFFDHVGIYMPLYSLFAFSAYNYCIGGKELQNKNPESPNVLLKIGSIVLGVFLVAVFIWTSVIPFYQMRVMVHGFNKEHFEAGDVEKMTRPNNFIQSELRMFALINILDRLPREEVLNVFPMMIDLGEEALEKTSNRARREEEMGLVYNAVAKFYKTDESLALGEGHLRKAFNLALGRQSTSFILAENLELQGRFSELEGVMNTAKAFEPEGVQMTVFYISILAPNDFDGRLGTLEKLKKLYTEGGRELTNTEVGFIRESYSNYMHYTYRVHDEAAFRGVLKQAIEIEKVIGEIIDFQVASGVINVSGKTREALLKEALETVDKYGLDAINLKY